VSIRLIDFSAETARPIELFSSSSASSTELAHGSGESHAYAIHFAPGGLIGPHPAGFDQLFLVVQGSGWVAGSDGVRHSVGTNRGVFIPQGEVHSKGSAPGMVVVMVQSSRFSLPGAQGDAEAGAEDA
jgi:quercetin dioxygenase-like cupin family protein